MNFTNRSVVLILVGSIFLVQGVLYSVTMYGVQSNGRTPHDFISMDGGDSYEYVALAETMLSDGRFAPNPTAAPETFRTPAYPLFVAGVLALTKDVVYLPLFQILLSALSAVLIFLIGTRFFNRTVGVISAILFAVDPSGPLVTFVSMSDMLFVFLLLVGTYMLVMYETVSRWRVFLSGIVIGVFALTRPMGLYIFPLFAVWLLWEGRDNWKQAFKMAGVFVIGVFLIVAPWMARNYVYYGHASISSIGTYNLLFYNIIDFEHERTGVSKEALHADILKQIGATDFDDYRALPYTDRVSAVASEYIFAHPFKYARYHILSVIPFYIGSSIDAETYSIYGRGALKGTPATDINVSSLILHGNFRAAFSALTDNMAVLIERLLWFILCIGAFGTAVTALYRRELHVSVIILFFALIIAFGVLTGPVSYPRYRLPAEPFIFILGAAGVASVTRQLRSVYSKRINNLVHTA